MIQITNEDNMELMARYPDNHFDLAIVDPPYGVSYGRGKNGFGSTTKNLPKTTDLDWDKTTPTEEYFKELQRVSQNQIIWGSNYFTDKIPVSQCWIVWDKIGDMNLKNPFADCELAWTSFNKVVKKTVIRQQGFISDSKEERIHPTQKPVKLYEWLLMNYAKDGDKILDTHLGSGSIAIACHNLGFDLTACELDTEYYEAALKRLKQHQSQLTMF